MTTPTSTYAPTTYSPTSTYAPTTSTYSPTTTQTQSTKPTPISRNIPDNYSDDLIISFYLLKKCKLWVWDFDDTLIDTKYYYKTSMEPDDIRNRTDTELTNEVPQWRYFKRLIEYLVKNGKYVAIASFGTYEIIKAYMDRILGFNQTFFTNKNLIAPTYKERELRSFSRPPNKNEYIYKIMKLYKIEDFKIVVLFDDLPSNIGDAIGVGIIGIQIATPNNGDRDGGGSGGSDGSGGGSDTYGSGGVSYSGSNMFFGPWVMIAFDKKIENDCGKEIYLNRTFTGIANKYRSKDGKGSQRATNSSNNYTIDNSIYSSMTYDKTDFRNGIKETFVPMAFGTGIGDRKITVNPEYRWNKMNISNPPNWVNGNWADSTLGGESVSFWDKYQRINKKKNSVNSNNGENGENGENGDNNTINIDMDNDDKYIYENITKISINNYNGKLNEPSNQVMGVTEGFESNEGFENDDCNSCKKFEWNWIVLVLMIIILMMIVIIYNVVYSV